MLKSGDSMKKSFYIGVILIVGLIFALLAYGVYLNQRSENNIIQRMAERRLPLHGAKVQKRNIYPVLELDLINFYSNELVDVTALIDGKINQVFVQQNSNVQAGEPIVELFNEDVPLQIKQADSDILRAQAELTRAENTYKRYNELVSIDAISKQKFDEAKADYQSAQALLDNSKAKRKQLELRNDRQIITASIDGEILRLYKNIGAYVTAGTPIALIGNFDTLFFETQIDTDFTTNLEVGQTSVIETINKEKYSNVEMFSKTYGAHYAAGNLGSNQIFTLTLVDISPPNSQPATIRTLTWKLDNSSGLLEPGFYYDIKIRSTVSRSCLSIPAGSTIDNKDNYVFVVDNGTLKLKKIDTGLSDDKFLQVISGLNEGDIVITSNTAGLTEGLPVEVTVDEEAF